MKLAFQIAAGIFLALLFLASVPVILLGGGAFISGFKEARHNAQIQQQSQPAATSSETLSSTLSISNSAFRTPNSELPKSFPNATFYAYAQYLVISNFGPDNWPPMELRLNGDFDCQTCYAALIDPLPAGAAGRIAWNSFRCVDDGQPYDPARVQLRRLGLTGPGYTTLWREYNP